MRSRTEIIKELKPDADKALEVLLDIRDLLIKQQPPKPRRKPAKNKSKEK
jgi:hypothetical protein